MSFLEEILEKLMKTGRNTSRKARDVADVLSLNADISSSQGRLRDLQTELGAFMEQNVFTDLDRASLQKLLEEDVEERTFTVRQWKELYEKLLYLRSEQEVIAMTTRKISRIKGEKVCPVCGEFVLPESKFCPQCGAKLNVEEAPAAAEEKSVAAEEKPAAPETPAEQPVDDKKPEEEKTQE